MRRRGIYRLKAICCRANIVQLIRLRFSHQHTVLRLLSRLILEDYLSTISLIRHRLQKECCKSLDQLQKRVERLHFLKVSRLRPITLSVATKQQNVQLYQSLTFSCEGNCDENACATQKSTSGKHSTRNTVQDKSSIRRRRSHCFHEKPIIQGTKKAFLRLQPRSSINKLDKTATILHVRRAVSTVVKIIFSQF